MEEAVLPADEAPTNTQTLGPDQTPEGREPENDLQFQAPRNVEGKFLKGQSGNPAGKPPGIRNRATMIVEQLFDGACGEVSREALAKAMNGDSAVLRLIVTRLIGPRRHRASSFALPPLENAADVAPPIAAIIAAAAAEGAISTAEACEMSQVVERYARALAGEEVEAHLQRLEGACGLAE